MGTPYGDQCCRRRGVAFQPMESYVCMLCDWVGTPEPFLVPSCGAGGIEILPLQPGGVKPLLYALEVASPRGQTRWRPRALALREPTLP